MRGCSYVHVQLLAFELLGNLLQMVGGPSSSSSSSVMLVPVEGASSSQVCTCYEGEIEVGGGLVVCSVSTFVNHQFIAFLYLFQYASGCSVKSQGQVSEWARHESGVHMPLHSPSILEGGAQLYNVRS